jgi:hypothetical protein
MDEVTRARSVGEASRESMALSDRQCEADVLARAVAQYDEWIDELPAGVWRDAFTDCRHEIASCLPQPCGVALTPG